MRHPSRVLLLSLACTTALAAQAGNASGPINVPPGDLAAALNTLARQSDTQLVYRADELKGRRTAGVQGAASTDQALQQLLHGSGFDARRDQATGAVLVARADVAPRRPAAPAPAAQDLDAGSPAAAQEEEVTEIEAVQVTGSRIPRAQIEGPAPISVITAEEIRANGFTSVPDILRGMTQNSGETQSQQSASGADFSPGAQQVDLRGLGPNHTLVLVNGRRIADFPMPFKGRSNFTDISGIPIGMIERVEVLTGSASAIYGSDAISGVVNFILKKSVDGVLVDMRIGTTSDGGGESFNGTFVDGFERGRFSGLFGVELQSQTPLWAYERSIQDSTLDAPTASSRAARRAWLRTDWWDYYIDPGQAACDALAGQNQGSTYYASRPGWGYDDDLGEEVDGYYCGSDKSIGYGTILSERRGVNGYASLSYAFDNGSEWFADVQVGYHNVELFRDVSSWSYMAPDGNEEGYFYNDATAQVEYWQRQFSPEEMGGLDRGMVETTQETFGATTGFKGTFAADWDYEASLSWSQYRAEISWPQIVAAAANALFLGPQLGVDDDGFPIFNADPARLYTPLTRDEYDSIAARSVYRPKSETGTAALTVSKADLFVLPGGDAGFAGTVEFGHQAYELNPDPLATQYYYYSWKDSDGHGSRNRWATAGELRMPVLESLNWSLAARYDQYRYSGNSIGKPTWSTGLEWRPLDSLLVRGSYGTAFRAPDLHYVYAGIGNDETSGNDYYYCLLDDADDCSDYEEGLIRTREGNRELDAETSTSWTAGFVWSPLEGLDLSADWFDIDMRDQVQDMSVDAILRDEAACRLGELDIASPTCVDAIARVTRTANDSLYGIYVNPINVARETTSGIDVVARYRFDTPVGRWTLSFNHTWVNEHEFQQFPGDPVEDEFAVNSGFDIPRTKSNASIGWENGTWSATLYGQRLGKLPNGWSYDQVWEEGDPGPYIAATYRYNASMAYRFNERSRLALAVTNLANKMPPKDPTYTAYPYYDISWFDSVGRTINLQFTHQFGGSAE